VKLSDFIDSFLIKLQFDSIINNELKVSVIF
jgi:hypothetical protein